MTKRVKAINVVESHTPQISIKNYEKLNEES